MHIDTPDDWENPDWFNISKCHDWKRYVSGELEDEWRHFTKEQKQMLARSFQKRADAEEWE